MNDTRVQEALHFAAVDAARCLLEESCPQAHAAGELLTAVEGASALQADKVPLLYALVASRQPLLPAEWARVPAPCPGLGAALPAVLHRSADEAARLVRRLQPADQVRLRALALCLGRAQQQEPAQRSPRLPPLPTPIVWRLLALSVAG